MSNSKRRCAACKAYFKPEREFPGTVAWCSDTCGTALALKRLPAARAKIEQKERAQYRQRKEAVKTRSQWLKEAQQAFNSYIRTRDAGNPCISCDRPDDGSHQRHASHYRSTKACSILRFNLRNVHASCAQCNGNLSGNLLEYRIRLVASKGSEFVEWLECQNDTRKYDIIYLKRLKKVFKKKALKSQRAQT